MKTIFLDLDGTLTDPKPGITGCFAYALQQMGLTAPCPDDLEWVIGPALLDSFTKLGVADPEAALAHYRVKYTDTGLFENRVYDGIKDALSRLRVSGHMMCLATAKPHAYATRITAHFELAPFLTHEFGPELDGTRNDKGELLAYALELIGLDASDCIMVGDRHHDIDAACAVGMDSITVAWGYGGADDLSHATRHCAAPNLLPDIIAEMAND